jgi:hypothetical protein
MCLACEEQEYFFRMWCAGFLARGELPPGVTAEDLEAMGFELPAALRAGGKPQPAPAAAPGAFACDSPDGE